MIKVSLQKSFRSVLSRHLVNEHESHLVATTVDSRDSLADRRDQVVERLEQHVGRDGSLQMSPQSLDQVQARAVRRQPENADLFAMLLEPLAHRFGVMESAVVADETDLTTGISPQQRLQVHQEIGTRLGRSDRVGDPAGRVIHPAVGHGLLILSRSRNLRLRANGCPDPAECEMAMDLDLILVNQDFRAVGAVVYFRSSSSLAACS